MARRRSKSRAFSALAKTFGIKTEVSPIESNASCQEDGVAKKPAQDKQVACLEPIPESPGAESPGTESPPPAPIPPKAKGFGLGRHRKNFTLPAHTPSEIQLRESLSLRRLQLSLGSSLTSTDTRLLSVPIYRAGPGHQDHNCGPQNHPHHPPGHQGAQRA